MTKTIFRDASQLSVADFCKSAGSVRMNFVESRILAMTYRETR